jgi:hypothetical protein
MDLGKQVRVVEIPDQIPARRVVEQPEPHHDEPIPLPKDWPTRSPARVPEKVGEWTER